MISFVRAAIVLSAAVLAGCAGGMGAAVDTLQYAVRRDRGATEAALDPRFRYLRATIEGHVVLLVLGYVEPHPAGPIELWYSGTREVVRLQNGRLLGASGIASEWRAVVLPQLPAWAEIARAAAPLRWVRLRDVMPGYRYGVRDVLEVRAIEPPSKSALQGLDAGSLAWFEEVHRAAVAGDERLPPVRYAVAIGDGTERVVFGEACLAPELCFTWQRWPAGR